MRKIKSKQVIVGGTIRLIIGVILGVIVMAGILSASPHAETKSIAITGFVITVMVLSILGIVSGYLYEKHKIATIFIFIGIMIQFFILYLNPNPHGSVILYWIYFPGIPILIGIIFGIIFERIMKK